MRNWEGRQKESRGAEMCESATEREQKRARADKLHATSMKDRIEGPYQINPLGKRLSQFV